MLWHVAELPLESGPIERVQFGIDEQANLLWAVERSVDSRETTSAMPDDPNNPKINAGKPSADARKAREYAYVPGEGIAPYWHPYDIDDAQRAQACAARAGGLIAQAACADAAAEG